MNAFCANSNVRPYPFFLSREIDGEIYPGDVKEKAQAQRQYQRAKQRGQSAGIISKK